MADEYGKPTFLEIAARLIKLDMLESLARHSHALWYGYHDEANCKWCQRYKR